MAGVVARPNGYALPPLRCIKQEGRVLLHRGLELRFAWGVGQTVKLGAVCCLPYGDTATILACHVIPRDTEEDLEEARRLGGRETWGSCVGDTGHLCAVTHRRLQGIFPGAQG